MIEEIKGWEELSREEIFYKHGRGIEKVVFKMPDGKKEDFYLKKEALFVCTLALTKKQEVILVRQFRPGPKKILLEMPGGTIDGDEDLTSAAERELLEETGYTGKVQFVAESFLCAYSTAKKYCLVVTDCEKVAEQKLDATEFIKVEIVSLSEFRQLLRSGQMSDVEVGYLGLDFLELL
ncbi:MAG: NUDIX hydrolase [Candidatus Moraniibacteriota bacterium]